MVRLRKSKNKLKIILCCILGFIVAVGGIVGILVLVPLMEGEKEPPVVDSAVNEKNDPGDMTYEQHAASGDDGYRTLTYLAYVLSEQPYYHSESVTVSVAPFNMTQYTKSFKDYSDGIMISSDLTYGIKNAGTQAAFVPDGNEEGRGAGVYMRTSSGSVNADSTGTSVSWNDDVVYYDRESYLYAYGEYSTEMTVYLLTEETITSWDPATDNGDGTYTQTFYLDAEKACYYYQYAMKTRGGLLTLPVFESISMEVTFDNNYRVLQIDVVENSRINPFTWMDSTSTTTTSYTYGEENFDRPHYDYYADYFEQYVGNLGSEDGDDDELTPLDLLMNAFAGVLNGEGQQFDAVVMAGGKTYYGRVYLSLDINGISSGDILGSIDARIALSEDENIDEQDLYISFADGDIRAYYSSDFALSADVNEFSDIVSQFESWVQRLSGDGTAAADEGDSADEGGFSLDELLQQFTNGTTVEYDGGLTYTASLEISGISLDAVFDFSEQDGGDAATYSLNSAQIGGIAYNGSPVELSLALEPSEGEIISHEESETPFDLSVAAQNLYELLNSDAIGVEISLGGEKLADFLSSLGIADLGASLDDLSLQISGAVDINGITVAAAFALSDINSGRTVLAADVYYVYNDGSGEYGTAYLNISNILGAETSAKVYCDIAELAATIQTLIDRLSSGDGAEGVSEDSEGAVSAADGSDMVSLINGILGLDLGAVVKEVNAGAAAIGATVDLDSVFALLGADVSLGDITLEYHLGDFDREDYNNAGGWLYGSIPSLGAEAYIYGSNAAVGGIEKDDYLDLDELIGSVAGVIDSAVVEINLEISGGALADVLASNGIVDLGDSADGLVLDIEGSVSASELEARLALSLHDENKIYFAADAYYVYGGEGYGTAYIDLTHILGASYDGIKVYCDIAELASAVGWLVDDAAGQSEGAGTEESAGIAGIITGILTIDLGGIVKELSANADGITTTVDIGGILEYFTETDIELGDVTLEYTFGEGGGRLSGTALGGGLTMSVTGSDAEISAPDTEEYYDLTALVNSIYEIFESNTVRVLLDITGEALSEILAENGITGADELLAGANIHVSGNIDIDTLAVKGTLSFSGADRTYFAADVFYSYDEDGYGDIYLSITELLGSECNIKVYGNIGDIISSVEELIGTVAGGDTAGGAASGAEVSQVADIVSQILSINLGSIVRWLRIDEYGVYASVDIDNLLGSLVGTELGLGSMQMQYDGHFLSGTAMNGGLELLLYGSEMNAYRPAPDAYLDIVDLLALINNAKAAVQKIIDGNSVYFSIANAEIAVNGVTFSVSGEGEAVWDDVSLVSLALDFTVATGGADGTSENSVKLIYNAGAAGDEPLVQLAINEVGLIITQNDIDRFGEDLNGLIAEINNLLGGTAGSSTGNADDSRLVAIFAGDDSVGNDVAGILQLILGIFNGEYEDGTLGNVLTELFDGLFSDLLEGCFGIEDGQLTVNVGGLNVTFSADPDEGLYLSGSAEDVGSFNVRVTAGTGHTPDMDGIILYGSSAEGSSEGSFTRAIYNFIFGAYEGVDIGSFLGGDTYSVEIKLNGANSDIGALKGVIVNANLFFTADKADGAESKLAGAEIDVTASGFTFAADATFSGETLYIALTEINGTALNIGLKASADNIYRAVENLIRIVQNEKVIGLVSGLIGGQGTAAPDIADIATYTGTPASPEGDSIADFIYAILSFNYSEIITIEGSGAESFVATLDIDELLNALNVNAGTPIGTATLKLADESGNRGIYLDIGDWLTVNAARSEGNSITVPVEANYIDIGFVADLIDDVNKFVSSRQDMLYTFTGDITIGVTALGFINLEISISGISLTLGINESGQFYASIVGNLSGDFVEESTIGATFTDNLITLARDIGTDKELYWIMTPEYFVDHMFDKTPGNNMFPDSPLHWLTRMSLWDTIAGILQENVDIGSGANSPEEWYLYDTADTAAGTAVRQNEQPISASQYISAFMASIGDTSYSFNGSDGILNNLAFDDITSGYYAASLNAGALTDNIVNTIDIGIARDDNNGIKSLNAYLALSQYVDITANIDLKYDRTKNAVVNHFDSAVSAAKDLMGEDYEFDFNAKDDVGYAQSAFGSVKVEKYEDDLAYDYTYTYAADYHTAIVHMADGSTQTRKLRYGSTIYLYDSANPDPDGDGYIIAYEAQDGTIYPHVVLDNEQPTTYEFTERLIKLNETVNGVAYTFVGSNEHNYAAHYAITGTTSDIGKYYDGTTLVLENEIYGFPVSEIRDSAFRNHNNESAEFTLDSVVVPETIVYVGAEAFKDNYGIKEVVFLADTVTLGGVADDGTTPFYGCSDANGSTNTLLTVYYNKIVFAGSTYQNDIEKTNDSSSIVVTNPTDTWTYFRNQQGSGWNAGSRYYYYFSAISNADNSGESWTYIDGYTIDISAEDNDALAMDGEAILSGLGNPVAAGEISSETYTQMAETVLANINNYTAAHYGYINGFKVAVEPVTGTGAQTAVVKITNDMANAWRESIGNSATVTVTNDDGTSEEVVLDIAYADGATVVVAGKTFVTPNSAVTISLNSAYASDYDLVSYDGNTVDSVTYTFDEEFTVDFVQSSVTIKEHETTYVSVYSEVSVEYIFNGANVAEQLAGSENIYLIPDYAVNGTLPAIATSEDNHYFLGWANKDATGNYQFVASATVDAFYEEGASELTTPDYYAIWAESSRELTVNFTPGNNANLPANDNITVNEDGVLFYDWYSDENFTNSIDTILDKTVVFARLQFSLTYQFIGIGENKFFAQTAGNGDGWTRDIGGSEGNPAIATISDGSVTDVIGNGVGLREGSRINVAVDDYVIDRSWPFDDYNGSKVIIEAYDGNNRYYCEEIYIRKNTWAGLTDLRGLTVLNFNGSNITEGNEGAISYINDKITLNIEF